MTHASLLLVGARPRRRLFPAWTKASSRRSTASASTSTPARSFGIVGESGCGKSVTMKAVLRIVEPPGRIVARPDPAAPARRDGTGGEEVVDLAEAGSANGKEMRAIRGGGDRADPAGADGVLQPGAHHRQPDHRSDHAAPADRQEEARPRSRSRLAAGRRHPDAGAAPGRLLLAAQRRPAPARHHRHGALLQPPAAHRRRADHRRRRDDPGPGSAPAAASCSRSATRRSSSSPTTWASSPRWPTTSWSCTWAWSWSRARWTTSSMRPSIPTRRRCCARSPASAQRRASTCRRSAARSRIPSTSPRAVPSIPRCIKRMPGRCDVRTPALQPVGDRQLVSCFLYHDAEVSA